MGNQKTRLDETVLLGTQNICEIIGKKILTILSKEMSISKPILAYSEAAWHTKY